MFIDGKERLSLQEWVDIYREENGVEINIRTIRKRRAVAGLGRLVPRRTYVLTKEEFEQVMNTPLPFCNQVVNL